MPYCTQQDMIDRVGDEELIQITNPEDPSATTINATRLDKAINDGAVFIDGFLRSRYQLPLSVIPEVLERLNCVITRYYLYKHPTDQVMKDYDDAVSHLRLVSKGDVDLGLSASGDTPPTSDSAEVQTQPTVFGRDDGGFI